MVADGKYYSCSSTAAGLDMTLWMVADQIDIDVAAEAAGRWDIPGTLPAGRRSIADRAQRE